MGLTLCYYKMRIRVFDIEPLLANKRFYNFFFFFYPKRLCITFSLNARTCKFFGECFLDWMTDVADENVTFTLKDVNAGFPERNPILNHLLILRTLYIWECRRANFSPNFDLSLCRTF